MTGTPPTSSIWPSPPRPSCTARATGLADRLEKRRDNLGAALSWLAGQDQAGKALDLVWATWRFWWLHGHVEELARHADRILARSEDLPPYQGALALTGPGFILIANGRPGPGAERFFEQSLPLYRQTSGKLGVVLNATVLAVLGPPRGQSACDYAGPRERTARRGPQALLREPGARDDLARRRTVFSTC